MNRLVNTCFIGGSTPASLVADLGFAVLRVTAGLMMAIAHGFQKTPPPEPFVDSVEAMGFPVPIVFAWAAALSESLGGLLLAAGLFTRPAALFIFGTMCVAGFVRHADDPFGEKELAFLYAAVMFAFMLAGSGRYSLDGLVRAGLGKEDRKKK